MKPVLLCLLAWTTVAVIRADAPDLPAKVVLPTTGASLRISLSAADTQAIYGLLAGQKPGFTSQARFSSTTATTANMTSNEFVKNMHNWAASVDLSCISAFNNRPGANGTKFQTTAISPRHGIGPAHTPAPIGSRYNWLASDGTTVTSTIIAEMTAANDIEIYLFDRDLPPTVAPARMLPPDWDHYLGTPTATPGTNLRVTFPVIMPTQEAVIYCNQAAAINLGPEPMIFFQVPPNTLGMSFNNYNNGHHGLWSGDSGFTQGMLINGDYVPIVETHFGGPGSGPFLPAYDAQINAAMHTLSKKADLDSDYQLTYVDLSGFARH